MKSNTFGLDIGTSTMKAVSLSRDKEVLSFEMAATGVTPAKGMISDSPFDQEDMADAIHQLVVDSKVATRSVNIALAENQVYMKVIEMPLLSDRELSSAIYWEAEQYIPAPLNTLTIDHQVLFRDDKTQTEPRMQVLLVGAPTVLINKYQNILGLAGLTIASLETEILSVIRAVIVKENFPTSFIVHLGAMSTSIAIIRGGNIIFTYSVPLGGVAINRAISSDFGFSLEQAEEYKKIYGINEDSVGTKINHAISPILMAVITELKKAVSFYSEKYKNDSPITQILLSGGTARLPGIEKFFVKNAGFETSIVNPWQLLTVQNVPQEIVDTVSEYTIAIGLALKEYEK
jgi:type IV pilus assembly protein PilM